MLIKAIEVRVGAFVLGALILLVGFVLVLGDFRIAPGFSLYADFAYSGGLQVGSPVKVSGIQVGRVTDLAILGGSSKPLPARPVVALGQVESPVVRATLEMDEPAQALLTKGVRFFVGMQGVIGEAYVEIEPGAREGPMLAEGSAVRGVDAPRLHVMALQLSMLLDTVGAVVGSESGSPVSELSSALTSLLGSVGGIVQERRAELSRAVGEIAGVTADLHAITSGLRTAVGDGTDLKGLVSNGRGAAATLHRELPAVIARTQTSLAAVEALTTKANRAVDAAEVEAILADLHETLGHLKQTAIDGRRLLETVKQGQGSIGGLITDPQVYDDLKELLRDLKRNPWKIFWRD